MKSNIWHDIHDIHVCSTYMTYIHTYIHTCMCILYVVHTLRTVHYMHIYMTPNVHYNIFGVQ